MTRSLFGSRAWNDVAATIESGEPILVGLDLDGTLAEIVDHPSRTRVTPRMLRLLDECARAPRIRVAIVSARSTAAIRRLIPTRGLLRVGQYGLEGHVAPSSGRKTAIRAAATTLADHARRETSEIPGVWVESKGFSIAIHDRRVPPRFQRKLHGVIRSLEADARGSAFHLVPGERVYEFVPNGFDKGTALRGLIRIVRPAATLYFGDSRADEPAFRVLGPRDVPVRVGPGRTDAPFRVDGPGDVARALSAVVRLRAAAAPVSRR